nr:S-adenosyl-L-methionine-dependent methyltransferases superfamily protein [Tanacetum cinerariifolium]
MVSAGLASLSCNYNLLSSVYVHNTLKVLCIRHGGGSLLLFLASKIPALGEWMHPNHGTVVVNLYSDRYCGWRLRFVSELLGACLKVLDIADIMDTDHQNQGKIEDPPPKAVGSDGDRFCRKRKQAVHQKF